LVQARRGFQVAIARGLCPEIQEVFKEDNPDHRILAQRLASINLRESENMLCLLLKDVQHADKAKALGIPAEDYTTDRVPEP